MCNLLFINKVTSSELEVFPGDKVPRKERDKENQFHLSQQIKTSLSLKNMWFISESILRSSCISL